MDKERVEIAGTGPGHGGRVQSDLGRNGPDPVSAMVIPARVVLVTVVPAAVVLATPVPTLGSQHHSDKDRPYAATSALPSQQLPSTTTQPEDA